MPFLAVDRAPKAVPLGGSSLKKSATPRWPAATRSPVHALRLWLECYGAFAGDLALHWLARGGVYLAGGIAAKLLPGTDANPFIEAFLAKREHRHLALDMPIRLVTDESLGLRGTLALAAG